MIGKVYLQNGMMVLMRDSIPAREINSVFKEAIVSIEGESIFFERCGKKAESSIEEIGVCGDDNGLYFWAEDED